MTYVKKECTIKKLCEKTKLTDKSIRIREEHKIIFRSGLDKNTILFDETLSFIRLEAIQKTKIRYGRSLREWGLLLKSIESVDNKIIEKLDNGYDENTVIDYLKDLVLKQAGLT